MQRGEAGLYLKSPFQRDKLCNDSIEVTLLSNAECSSSLSSPPPPPPSPPPSPPLPPEPSPPVEKINCNTTVTNTTACKKYLCKETSYKHCDFLYSIVDSFYSNNLPVVYNAVRNVYINNDFTFIEKCFKCKECNINTDYNNFCPNNPYHGTSLSMEIYNTITLFKRPLQHGFRYSTYVSDGDSKVFPALSELGIYMQ